MISILSVLAIVSLSVLVTRIASIALEMTGLPRETARFQARSAFTGVGFTTREAESITVHPDRRRIVLLLMLLGSAGLVTTIATLMLSFVRAGSTGEVLQRGGMLVGGLLTLVALTRSERLERRLRRVIEWALRRTTKLDAQAFSTLLELEDEFSVLRMKADPGSWLADRTLADLALPDEGVFVLGIVRPDGSYVGSPRGRYHIHRGDELVLYGPESRLTNLADRLADRVGEAEHERAVEEHQGDLAAQDQRQEAYDKARNGSRGEPGRSGSG